MTEQLDGLSMDLEGANKEKLQSVFPECFTEGRLDIDKLLSLCGNTLPMIMKNMNSNGKAKAIACAWRSGAVRLLCAPVRRRASLLTRPKISISKATIWKC